MNAVKKTAMSLIILLIVVVVGVFLFVSSNIGSLIVDAVETYGPRVTQSSVSLDSADVAISGEGEMNGLTVGNPQGYMSDSAFQLGAIKLALDTDSLTSDVIRIKSIDIVSPALNYEMGGKAGSNLQQLVKNVQKFAASQGGGAKEPAEGEKEKKLIIDRLTIRDGKIAVITPLSDTPLKTGLPTIELTDIGKKKGGSSPAEVVKLVMEKVTASASSVSNLSVDELKKKLGSQVTDKLQGIEGKVQDAGLGDKAGEVGDKLKSIFK